MTSIDIRPSEAYSTYNKYVILKYGEDTILHPEIDMEQDKIEKHALLEKIEERAKMYAGMNKKIQLLSQNPPPT
ncbi:hypothetical protein HanRHA438_Chr09g0423291 [Helianthus annuus]|uniref:Uncharacterized protein n=1 Tax=Helianthus annuus TaxID=4232 RepID=A0A9K3NAF3_HELAN|nr:hypothetical protein HanXRQr2_Chr09g0411091 [Helianthus annuus]KAJ0890398.1 hypothetical protein HanRHA438_Chr09g0423291 [Helianthus annuus]KAJ0895156.1 hypothetical protein HanPSC8_Chr09g0397191 [Helianthus annuus]